MAATNKTIEEKLKELKAPISLKWRVQSVLPNKTDAKEALMISYIDARDVAERLDAVIGASGWQNDFKEVKGVLQGGIGIKCGDEWVWKWDAGVQSNTEKEKGESSDAFKRAAVKWGINRESYQIGTVKIKVAMYNGKPYPADDNGKFLKGDKLHLFCNSKVRLEDLDNAGIEITDGFLVEKYHNLEDND